MGTKDDMEQLAAEKKIESEAAEVPAPSTISEEARANAEAMRASMHPSRLPPTLAPDDLLAEIVSPPPEQPTVADMAAAIARPRALEYAWEHPGRVEHPQTVAVVALGPTKHDLLEMQTTHEPGLLDIDEVWGINAAVNWFNGLTAFDVLWVMDYLEGEAAKHPKYVRALCDWHERFEDCAIMTSIAGTYDDIAYEYPLREVWGEVQEVSKAPAYFRNTMPYVLAYAWWIGVKRLYLFGVDYSHPSLGNLREADRANCEYWIGFVRAQGVEVIVPDTSTILSASTPFALYGYPPGAERAMRFADGECVAPGELTCAEMFEEDEALAASQVQAREAV